jgi:hypothetical protein
MGNKAKWPKEVPVLRAEDICRHRMNGAHGTRCLLGWSIETFGYAWLEPAAQKAVETLEKECGCPYIDSFNDDRRNSLATVARTWNKAMARLGYTENNPEAKRVKSK